MKELSFNVDEKTYFIVKVLNYNDNDYIIYTDNQDYYASKYEIINDKLQLLEIENDDIYDYLDKELEKLSYE